MYVQLTALIQHKTNYTNNDTTLNNNYVYIIWWHTIHLHSFYVLTDNNYTHQCDKTAIHINNVCYNHC